MSVDDWRNDRRGPWVRNSLLYRRDEMRKRASNARASFSKHYMGEVADYLADAYDEAAAVFQRKLDECAPASTEVEREPS